MRKGHHRCSPSVWGTWFAASEAIRCVLSEEWCVRGSANLSRADQTPNKIIHKTRRTLTERKMKLSVSCIYWTGAHIPPTIKFAVSRKVVCYIYNNFFFSAYYWYARGSLKNIICWVPQLFSKVASAPLKLNSQKSLISKILP